MKTLLLMLSMSLTIKFAIIVLVVSSVLAFLFVLLYAISRIDRERLSQEKNKILNFFNLLDSESQINPQEVSDFSAEVIYFYPESFSHIKINERYGAMIRKIANLLEKRDEKSIPILFSTENPWPSPPIMDRDAHKDLKKEVEKIITQEIYPV